MTPKEKAIELVLKFKQRTHYVEVWHTPQLLDKFHHNAISCALIAVDELICEVYNISHQYTAIYDITTSSYLYTDCKELTYWNNVKQEIEAL